MPATFSPETDLVDLKGRVVIVTGGNRGIGYYTVKHLARHGAKVYLAARNESAAAAAISKLKSEGLGPGNGEIVWLKLDLSDPKLAKEAGEAFLKLESRLDVLVNNAGLMMGQATTPDGMSLMAVVNYLSPFAFTHALTPLLVETAKQADSDVRIVNVATAAHKLTPSAKSIRFRTKDDFTPHYRFMSGFFSYCHSKLPIIPWTQSLQRRFSSESIPITCISLHPGGVDTYSQTFPLRFITSPLTRMVLYTPEQGSYTSLFAAASKKIRDSKETYEAAYLEPFTKLANPLKEATDANFADELWATTEVVLKDLGGL
ncbi:hypothetical protein ONZ45_g14712 [Pleurotus djamor]|nr:hypothetical protein ONZ45_g14712 [Pleurotus djamor]